MNIRPTKPYDDRAGDESRDFAAAGAFSLYALERMLRDCAEQPEWRLRARVASAYYDGKQLSEMQRWNIRQEDLEERAINLIRPVINSVLGQEASSRTDVKVEADDDTYQDVAEVTSMRLKEAERETRAHSGVSEAYASQVKKGLGWVHVSRNADPLGYPYRFESVPIDEIWWDWRGQRGVVLDDRCRWLVRMRMIDLDELEAAMPEHKEVLRRSINGFDNRVVDGNLLGEPEETVLIDAWENERRFSVAISKWDWLDTARKMIKVFEVWYRVPAIVPMLHLSPLKRVPYDEKDPRHVEAVARGLVKITRGVTSQVRRALYAGPHRLLDEATTRRTFPYVPFFAFRDDEDSSPYGLIDGMIAPQDEYNERRLRIQWMLKARQVQMDSDALDVKHNTIADITDNVMRPDLVAITNPNRKNNRNGVAVKVANELSMQPEQFEVMQDSKELIQHTAGRFNSQLGSAQVQSGIANSLLIQQGEQSMGELNDNYIYSKRCAFEELTGLILEDLQAPNLRVPVGSGKARRVVVLNAWEQPTQKVVDEATGQAVEAPAGPPQPVNMVKDASIKTALAETPNTPAYRQQTQEQVAKIIQALGNNQAAVGILAPAYIESTTLTNRQEYADALRKAAGLPLPGDKEAQAQAEAQQQQQLARQAQILEAKAVAEVQKTEAGAAQSEAAARKTNAEAEIVEQKAAAGAGTAEVQQVVAQTQQSMAAANDEDALIEEALAAAGA